MVFEGKAALSTSYEKLVTEFKGIRDKYAGMSIHSAFEFWIQNNTMIDWIKKNELDLIWPKDNYTIGETGNELGVDIGMIVKEDPGDGSEPIFRALVCQVYYPDKQNFEKPPKFKEKALDVAGAINSLINDEGNKKRKEFIEKLKEHSILSEDDGEYTVLSDLVQGFYAVFGLWPTKQNGELSADSKIVKAAEKEDGLIVFDARYLCGKKWIEDNPSGFPRPDERELEMAEIIDNPVNGVTIGLVSAENLHDFFKEDRDDSPWIGEKNQSLLDSNLRFQIEGESKTSEGIASGMKQTLKDEPSNFLKYNNGIVIVASNVVLTMKNTLSDEKIDDLVTKKWLKVLSEEGIAEDLETTKSYIDKLKEENNELYEFRNSTYKTQVLNESASRILTLSEPSIVNGGQTTNAIYDVLLEAKNLEEDGPEGHIQVKIVQIEDEKMSKSIARYANKQNTIDDRDQHATDDDQQEYYNLLISDKYMFWDYKRGLKDAKLSKDELKILNSGYGKRNIREIHNTKVLQRTAAIIGLPDRSFGYKKELWADDRLIEFVFAQDRTEELQIKVNRAELIVSGKAPKEAKGIPMIREGREEFCKDMILSETISRMRNSVLDKRGKRVSYVNSLGEGDMSVDEKAAFERRTLFHTHWEYALQRAFFRVLDKYTTGTTIEEKKDSRSIVRNNLLDGDFWKDNKITNSIFNNSANWNKNCKIEVKSKDHDIIPEGDVFEKFKLMGLWMKSLQDIFMEIPENKRNNRAHFTGRDLYIHFDEKLDDVIGNSGKLVKKFPTEMPVDDEVWKETLETAKEMISLANSMGDETGKEILEEQKKILEDTSAPEGKQNLKETMLKTVEKMIEKLSD